MLSSGKLTVNEKRMNSVANTKKKKKNMVFITDRICPTSVEHTVAGLQHKTIKILWFGSK